MAYTTAQLNALEAAIAQGVTSVSYRDRTVQYRSLNDMIKLRDQMRRDLGLITPETRRYYSHSKGL